jgi:hypothetical protein
MNPGRHARSLTMGEQCDDFPGLATRIIVVYDRSIAF